VTRFPVSGWVRPTLTGSAGPLESPGDRARSGRSSRLSPHPPELAVHLSSSHPSPVHRPVLRDEVIDALIPRRGAIIVDGTVGAGGHASALAQRIEPGGRLIGLDRDPEMLALAQAATATLPVTLVRAAYRQTAEVLHDLGIERIDGFLLDLGLSSDQLHWSHRGFSFSQDGPLDMRFDPDGDVTAADLVNQLSAEDLANVFYQYGEERYSRRVARRIIEARRVEPITTTGRLAELVRRSIPGKWGPIDPATRVFQALRIRVNDELEQLDATLAELANWLHPGGRVAIISFHSLEDRRVKHAFRNDSRLHVLTKKPITATAEEIERNPRARSAKLRVAERCTKPTGNLVCTSTTHPGEPME
jgi:16S rRNA (cytosine1402-N4)-methyltransferase